MRSGGRNSLRHVSGSSSTPGSDDMPATAGCGSGRELFAEAAAEGLLPRCDGVGTCCASVLDSFRPDAATCCTSGLDSFRLDAFAAAMEELRLEDTPDGFAEVSRSPFAGGMSSAASLARCSGIGRSSICRTTSSNDVLRNSLFRRISSTSLFCSASRGNVAGMFATSRRSTSSNLNGAASYCVMMSCAAEHVALFRIDWPSASLGMDASSRSNADKAASRSPSLKRRTSRTRLAAAAV
mmetsp:Transcript_106170/g.297225  ORF Transcript_106170/g.297225 Transcript_106170/m.297225 type:complete len:239 (-) Transcript_106170:1300-2016(-)